MDPSVERRGPGRRADDRQRQVDEERLRAAFLHAPSGIALLDERQEIVGVNPALCRLVGRDPAALLHVPVTALIHPNDVPAVKRLLDAVMGTEHAPEGAEVRCARSDGTARWVELTLARIADEAAGNWVVAQLLDVHDRRAALERVRASEARSSALARELRERNAQLHESNERLRRFASLASHDLSAPLASISKVLALIERRSGAALQLQDRELLAVGRERAAGMRVLVHDMLEYARGAGTLAPELVDLGVITAEALESLGEDELARDPLVQIEPLPTVCADPGQLLRVMRNLLGNAVKYAGADVRPRLRVDARRRPNAWEIRVADNGPGVAEADRKRIFGMLERAHPRSVPGSGLGLAICAEIVGRHGGEIWVEPVEGGGSRFAFTLPDGPVPGDALRLGSASA